MFFRRFNPFVIVLNSRAHVESHTLTAGFSSELACQLKVSPRRQIRSDSTAAEVKLKTKSPGLELYSEVSSWVGVIGQPLQNQKEAIKAEANGLADCYTLSKQANYLCKVSLSAMLVFQGFFFFTWIPNLPTPCRWFISIFIEPLRPGRRKSQRRWTFGRSGMLTCTSVYTTRHFSLDCSLFIARETLSHLPLLHFHPSFQS